MHTLGGVSLEVQYSTYWVLACFIVYWVLAYSILGFRVYWIVVYWVLACFVDSRLPPTIPGLRSHDYLLVESCDCNCNVDVVELLLRGTCKFCGAHKVSPVRAHTWPWVEYVIT